MMAAALAAASETSWYAIRSRSSSDSRCSAGSINAYLRTAVRRVGQSTCHLGRKVNG